MSCQVLALPQPKPCVMWDPCPLKNKNVCQFRDRENPGM